MKNKRGITLIALIITIIVLLILAGVVLTLTIGERGVINMAKSAGDKYKEAEQNELNQLENLYAEIGNLPENTPDTDAGTIVKTPDKWVTDTPNKVSTENGQIVVESTKIATVDAVSTGDGNIVPVPKGFYYVGGNLDTGVVISDNYNDSYEKNKKDMTDHSQRLNLVGNQFVFIPCTEEEYVKTPWGQGDVANRSNAYWDTTVDTAGEIQAQKYGGFYIGRYEAGLADTIEEYTVEQASTSNIYNVEEIPQSKAGIVPWNFVDWNTAKKNSENMAVANKYTTVTSGLITGTQWDVTINKIANKDNTKSLTSSGSWGNYLNQATIYTGRIATYNKSTSKLSTFSSEVQENATKNANVYGLLTTGASEKTKTYNLYDIAGNVWEWTDETSWLYNTAITSANQYRVLRGGSCHDSSSADPACYRSGSDTATIVYDNVGFRVALFIK